MLDVLGHLAGREALGRMHSEDFQLWECNLQAEEVPAELEQPLQPVAQAPRQIPSPGHQASLADSSAQSAGRLCSAYPA